MTLQDWIIKTGAKKVSKLLRVEPVSVSNWKRCKQLPRPRVMVSIYKLTNGEVTYKEMIETFDRKNKTRKTIQKKSKQQH